MQTVSDYLFAKASAKRIPLMGTFELSPVCNFACKMCYVRKTPAQILREGKQLLDWNQWLELGKQCYDAGMLYLLLTGGEPFLYPNFRELYIALHKMGILLSINTNGTMIDESTMQWLKAYAPQRVNITLYGASAETYHRICGQEDGYDRAMRAIHMLKEAGIPLVINASMIPENACDQKAILDIGKGLDLNVRMATYMFPPVRREREKSDSRFTPEESAKMFINKARYAMPASEYRRWLETKLSSVTVEQDGDDGDWGAHQQEYMRCRAGRSNFWVSWDGNMSACGIVPFPLEVYPFKKPFSACWEQLTQAVRSTPVLSGCAGCPNKAVCMPCVAMICTETGNAHEKAPYMCQLAQCAIAQMKEELEGLKNE